MRSFGVKLPQRKSDVLTVTPELLELCNELGIEVMKDVEGLEIWLRAIFSDGNVWVQIGGTNGAGSMYGVASGQMESKASNFYVVKNMQDVNKVANRVTELFGDQDKKGYNKEFKQVAKELNFKVEWNLEEIDKLSKAILKGLKPASEKYAEFLKKYSWKNESVNECMHPHFFDCGFYDAANANNEELVEILKAQNIGHEYDPYRNFVRIETTNPRAVKDILTSCRMEKMSIDNEIYAQEDPNDCVLICMPAPNVPEGAML
jgi:hypothetical protein